MDKKKKIDEHIMGEKSETGKKLIILLIVLNGLLYLLPVFSASLRNAFLSMGWWVGKLIMFIPLFAGYIWARNVEIAACIIDIAFAFVWLFPSKVGEIFAPDAVTTGCVVFCAAVNLFTVYMLAKSTPIQDYLYAKRNK